MEFNSYKLRNVLMEKGYIRGPFGSALKRSELLQEGVPVYEQKNAIYNVRTFRYFVSKEKYEELKRFTVKPYDLLISCSGTVGRTSIITPKDPKGIISQALLILRPDVNIINPYYLYYFFQSKKGHNELINRSSGSVQVNIAKRNIIENISIDLPSISNQKKIVDFLSSLDNKINSNKNIIANLEELSQTLFKRWFVDFEFPDENGNPYKSSDGEMINSELGEIPEGWTVKPLKEFIDIIDNRGKTPPLDKKIKTHPIIDVKALGGDSRVIDYKKCLKFVSEETYNNWFRSGHPKKGDTLLSTVGSIGEIKMFYYDVGTIAQNVVSLRSENSYFTYDLINNVKSSFLTFNIGSVQPSIKITHINKIKVVYPSKIVIENYEKMIKKLISDLYVKDLENQKLTQLRDILLPKLISGEIEIPDDI